ncbi:hypothetical protein BH10PSE11_BH10PSE11_13710 [soil metagenome]
MKLSDKQLVILSAASRRAHQLVSPTDLKDAPAKAAATQLLKSKLLEEIPTTDAKVNWRQGKDNQRLALRITSLGLKTIQMEKKPVTASSKVTPPSAAPQKIRDKTSKTARKKAAVSKTRGRKPREGSMRENVLGLLRRREGATLDALVKATGWQRHSVRGFLAGIVRRQLKLALVSEQIDGARTYRISGKPPVAAAKPARRTA